MKLDSLGFLHLAGISSHSAPALHAAKNRRGGDDHDTLPVRAGCVPGSIHSQLDLPLLLRGAQVLRPDCGDCWHHPDDPVL